MKSGNTYMFRIGFYSTINDFAQLTKDYFNEIKSAAECIGKSYEDFDITVRDVATESPSTPKISDNGTDYYPKGAYFRIDVKNPNGFEFNDTEFRARIFKEITEVSIKYPFKLSRFELLIVQKI